MLTCIARSKQQQLSDDSIENPGKFNPNEPSSANKQPIKSLTSQIKDMAMKASGAYKQCSPCTSQTIQKKKEGSYGESDSVGSVAVVAGVSEKFKWAYKRTGSSNSSSTAGRRELEARLKGISSGEVTPASISSSASGRRVDPVVFVEENEPKEWVAQVDPGVLITFVSLPRGGNDLKRIRFSREKFNKWQAQKWWAENYERVMELYNVQRLNRQAFPLPTPSRSEDESSKIASSLNSPITPPLTKERALYRSMGYSSSDQSLDQQSMNSRYNYDSCGVGSTPKLSSISGAKTEASCSVDASVDTSSSRDVDRSEEVSISNASELEAEWVEQDEPGVYITIRAFADGRKELRRVRFSREQFGEMHARLWWAENRARVHKQYL